MRYPPCYLCSDDGLSQITNPDFLVPLPSQVTALIGMSSVTCEDMRRVGEDLRRIPPFACPLLDREDLREACGCTNAISANNATSSSSSSMPVVEPAPAPASAPIADVLDDDATAPFPPCYICSDEGRSTIAHPEALVPLPRQEQAFVGLVNGTCDDMRRVGEEEFLIPPWACPSVDREDLRMICGCFAAPRDDVTTDAANTAGDGANNDSGGGLDVGVVAGAAVAGLAVLAAVFGFVFVQRRKKQQLMGGAPSTARQEKSRGVDSTNDDDDDDEGDNFATANTIAADVATFGYEDKEDSELAIPKSVPSPTHHDHQQVGPTIVNSSLVIGDGDDNERTTTTGGSNQKKEYVEYSPILGEEGRRVREFAQDMLARISFRSGGSSSMNPESSDGSDNDDPQSIRQTAIAMVGSYDDAQETTDNSSKGSNEDDKTHSDDDEESVKPSRTSSEEGR